MSLISPLVPVWMSAAGSVTWIWYHLWCLAEWVQLVVLYEFDITSGASCWCYMNLISSLVPCWVSAAGSVTQIWYHLWCLAEWVQLWHWFEIFSGACGFRLARSLIVCGSKKTTTTPTPRESGTPSTRTSCSCVWRRRDTRCFLSTMGTCNGCCC